MKEGENVLRILKETKSAIQDGDSTKLRALSNQTINTASLTHDPDNIAVAVVVYSLSKIIERTDYKELKGWKNFYERVNNALNYSIEDLQKDKEEKFRKDFALIRKEIGKLSGKLRKYIGEVFRMASINKASRIYEHGISMEKTAKLLGITMFELADYAGQTGISDVPESKTMNVKSRIKLAMGMFK